jgi:hypothetical protein
MSEEEQAGGPPERPRWMTLGLWALLAFFLVLFAREAGTLLQAWQSHP